MNGLRSREQVRTIEQQIPSKIDEYLKEVYDKTLEFNALLKKGVVEYGLNIRGECHNCTYPIHRLFVSNPTWVMETN